MQTETKAKIIEELTRDFFSDPELYDEQQVAEFLIYNDLGVPLAQGLVYDLIDTLTSEGLAVLEETWKNMCLILEADPYGEYETLDDVILFGDEED